jgi:hypothetical protein
MDSTIILICLPPFRSPFQDQHLVVSGKIGFATLPLSISNRNEGSVLVKID